MKSKSHINEQPQICFRGGDDLVSRGELNRLKFLDIKDVQAEDLQELSEVKLYSDLPVQERLALFLCQIGNPYCFKVNGTPVQISFSDGRRTLDEVLNNYLSNRKDYDRM
jgi:hypothetical protein